MILKQSIAVDVLIGPFLDISDGAAAESGESPSVKLSKNGQTLAAKNDVTTPTHDADGYYNCELDATDTNTVGQLVLTVAASANALPVRHEFQVMEEATYDALYGASANGFNASGAVTLAAATHTGAVIPTVTTLTGHTAQTGDSFARIGANGAGLSAIPTIATVTNLTNLPTMPTDWVTAAGMSAGAVSEIQSGLATPTNITAGTITTATNVTNDVGITQAGADKVWSSATRTLTAFSTSLALSVWDVLESAIVTASTIGIKLKTNLDATVSSRMAEASINTTGGAVDTVTSVTNDVGITATAVDNIWDEDVDASHQTAGTAGKKLDDAGGAADPWATALPGAYGAGTAGNIVGNNLDGTVSSRMAEASISTTGGAVDTATNLTNLPTMPTDWITNTGLSAGAVTEIQTGLATPTNITAGTITTATNVTNDVGITQAGADKVWASATRTLTAFSTSLALSVWDVLESAIVTASTIGLKLKTNLDATISSRMAEASINTTGGAVDTVTSVTNDVGITATAVDNIWDEDVDTSHQTAGSAGKKLDDAGGAADPWATALPGAYGAGTAGNIVGNNLDSPISTAQADLDTITGSDGATLATTQSSYAPSKAGDAMALTAGAVDAVWDESITSGAHNVANSSGKFLRQLRTNGTYAGGAVYIDTVNGSAGTEDYENGTDSNPVNTIADANTLATSLGISRFVVLPGSTITLAATQSNQVLEGHGWTLALGGQSIVGSKFIGATVSGIASGVGTTQVFEHCFLNVCSHIKGTHVLFCSIQGTQTMVEAGDIFFDHCHSGVAGISTPTFDFGTAIGDTNLNIRHYSGGIQLEAMGDTGTDTASVEGHGQVVEGTCTGGTVAIRGNFTTSGITNLTLNDDARIDVAQINAEVDNALTVTTYPEPPKGAPGATLSLKDKIGYTYKAWRNKATQTATTYSLFNDDAATVDHDATVSDSAGTATRGEMTDGP